MGDKACRPGRGGVHWAPRRYRLIVMHRAGGQVGARQPGGARIGVVIGCGALACPIDMGGGRFFCPGRLGQFVFERHPRVENLPLDVFGRFLKVGDALSVEPDEVVEVGAHFLTSCLRPLPGEPTSRTAGHLPGAATEIWVAYREWGRRGRRLAAAPGRVRAPVGPEAGLTCTALACRSGPHSVTRAVAGRTQCKPQGQLCRLDEPTPRPGSTTTASAVPASRRAAAGRDPALHMTLGMPVLEHMYEGAEKSDRTRTLVRSADGPHQATDPECQPAAQCSRRHQACVSQAGTRAPPASRMPRNRRGRQGPASGLRLGGVMEDQAQRVPLA